MLVHLDKESGMIELRHFAIRAAPLGVSKPVKKITRTRIPDLGKLEDISEVFGAVGSGFASDSEPDDDDTHVTLPQNFAGRGNTKSTQSAIRLTEIGPRLSMELVKIEKGLCDGEVLYNAHITKTPEEVLEQRKAKSDKDALRTLRRKEQETNVARKKAAAEEKKSAKLARKRARMEEAAKEAEADGSSGDEAGASSEGEESETDASEGETMGGAGGKGGYAVAGVKRGR